MNTPRINSIVSTHIGNLQFSGKVVMICKINETTNEYCIETGWHTCERVKEIDSIVTY